MNSDLASATKLPDATSVTHTHLLACINTRLASHPTGGTVRICDVGCGRGELIAYLADCLPILYPATRFELYGVDVADSGVQEVGFFEQTARKLADRHPDEPWNERLHLISSKSEWPFEDGFFDVVLSNQVLEHVRYHDIYFRELYRTLVSGGFSIHLFPLKHVIMEGHIHMPLVHRITQHGLLRSYIKLMSKLGIGSYRSHRQKFDMSLDYYAEEHADYMTFMTNYLSHSELLRVCKIAGLRADFSHTGEFYLAKLRQLLRRPARYRYSEPSPFLDRVSFVFYKRASSITLVIEKKNIYSR